MTVGPSVYPGLMRPGDYVQAPDSQAVRLVDVAECGRCGAPWVDGDPGWHRNFRGCTCVGEGRGHWTWTHRCGWSLTAPPHREGHHDQPYV